MDNQYLKYVADALEQTAVGSLLMTGTDPANPMTIGWAQFGVVWSRPVLTVFVRHSRYSHKLIEDNGVFTVSFPAPGQMREALAYCGKTSGRDEDKLKTLHLETLAPRSVGAPALKGCAIHVECRVVFKAESDLKDMDPKILDRYYKGDASEGGDPHTIYFGEIIDIYRT